MPDRPERDIENDIAKDGMKEEMDAQQDNSEDLPGDVHSKTEIRRDIRTQLKITKDRNKDVLNEFREGMDRRTFLKVLGFGMGGAILATTGIGGAMTREILSNRVKDGETPTGYAGTSIAEAPGSNEVRVSSIEEAVSAFSSGTKVILEQGTYSWDGSGIFGDYENASLIGDGPVTLEIPDGTRVNGNTDAIGGTVLVKNLTVRGVQGSGKNRIAPAATSGATIIFENFNQPDGAYGEGHPSPIGFRLRNNEGECHMRSCHVEDFYNNGFYGGAPGPEPGAGGIQVIEGCFAKNNDVDSFRLGSDDGVVRESVIVQDGTGRWTGGNGIRIREAGDDISIENVHMTYEASARTPFRISSGHMRYGEPSATVNGLFIRNETSTTPIQLDVGDISGQNICIKGSGSHEIQGVGDFTNVRTGGECTDEVMDEPPEGINYMGAGSTGGTLDIC